MFGYELENNSSEDFQGNDRHVNIGFCGYLDTSLHKLYKPLHLTNYVPKLGQNNFKFSIMDGEGGPGGLVAGGNSAYDKYGNNTYGSIAAKVDFGYDASSVVLTYDPLIDQSGFHLQALIGGSTPDSSEGSGVGPMGTGNADIAEGGDGLNLIVDPNNSNLWRERYVLSGPFFTGSIAMNPVVGEGSDAANNRLFSTTPKTTQRPSLLFGQIAKVRIYRLAGGDQEYIDNGFHKKNWLKSSYPWPQITPDASGIPYGENYPLDSTPFCPSSWVRRQQ